VSDANAPIGPEVVLEGTSRTVRGAHRAHSVGWWVTLIALTVAIFVVVYLITGADALGAAMRLVWNALVFSLNAIVRLFSGMTGVIARALGFRRLGRIAFSLTGVGLAYAGGVILTDRGLQKASGWRGKLKAVITHARNRWQDLHVGWKLAIVGGLIASQVYLHFLLIIFPIAFLVPFVRQLWVQAVDITFGGWYRKKFGRQHKAFVAKMKAMPVIRPIRGWLRLTRLRYLCAWRTWRYNPRYLHADGHRHAVSLIEPMRLWWHNELDRYVGHPLLAGQAAGPSSARANAGKPPASSEADEGAPREEGPKR